MNRINVICRSEVTVREPELPVIAVDAGLEYALRKKLNIVAAIGDFDSLPQKLLDAYHGKLIKIPPEKDQSDLELALAFLRDFSGEIYVYGALGRRMDHCLVNLRLCYYSPLRLILLDEQNEVFRLAPGSHMLTANSYEYLSFFTFQTCRLSLTGFKYPLKDYLLKNTDNLTLSNELSAEYATVENDHPLLVIRSRDQSGLYA